MANHKQAKKRILRNEKHRVSNKSRMSKIRTSVKKALLITSGEAKGDAKASLATANSQLAKGVKHGIVSKARLARVMSKLSKQTAARKGGANAKNTETPPPPAA